VTLDKFSIIKRADSVYYVIFDCKPYKSQSLGTCSSRSGATRRVKAFAKRNSVMDYLTIYSENPLIPEGEAVQ